ncbi:MAG: N-acetylmuramoyl-L-alanine amidase [Muribaculaceae bacterium]|nr:N-acetylmuramoyl-L-alanine amidase [Muribaculaceae bacterium]
MALISLLLTALMPLAAKNFVVTLDAGHGGHDYGAIGEKTNEKTLTLAVVRKLGRLIEERLDDVDVVYTRDKDVFIPLNERAAIANNAKSDLFISVHINSVDKRNKNRRIIEGCQVYTLGLHKTAENLAVAKRENAVMELEPDHTEKYAGFDPNSLESDIVFELSQNKRLDQSIEFADAVHHELSTTAGRVPKGVRQAGFWVLWATSMPSVLVELDFICNPKSEKFMASDGGQESMVTSLYNAFCAYLNTYGSQVTGRQLPPARAIPVAGKQASQKEAAPVLQAAPAVEENSSADVVQVQKGDDVIPEISSDSDKPVYYVQILASATPLPANSSELKSVKDVEYYRDGGLYKYAVGKASSQSEAKKLLAKIKKTFPQAFIVKMERGRRVDFIKP